MWDKRRWFDRGTSKYGDRGDGDRGDGAAAWPRYRDADPYRPPHSALPCSPRRRLFADRGDLRPHFSPPRPRPHGPVGPPHTPAPLRPPTPHGAGPLATPPPPRTTTTTH